MIHGTYLNDDDDYEESSLIFLNLWKRMKWWGMDRVSTPFRLLPRCTSLCRAKVNNYDFVEKLINEWIFRENRSYLLLRGTNWYSAAATGTVREPGLYHTAIYGFCISLKLYTKQ